MKSLGFSDRFVNLIDIDSVLSDYAALFATMIARTAKDMDVLIDSLPSEEAAPELQVRSASRKSVWATITIICLSYYYITSFCCFYYTVHFV